jgi:site-specific recombinase XerD
VNANVSVAPLLQGFFTTRLMQQKQVSPHTISSYRGTFRLLLKFLSRSLRQTPSRLCLDHIDTRAITAFLHELEKERKIGARTRNLRLSAIRSFFNYVASSCPIMQVTSSRCWRSLQSDTREGWSIFLHGRKRRRCLDHRT